MSEAGGRRPDQEVLFGVHPVEEAIRARSRFVERIFAVSGVRGGRLGRILRQAREAGVPVTHLPRALLARKLGRRVVHQGIAAVVAPLAYADGDVLCRGATSGRRSLLVALDRVADPRNLGAVVRSAAAAGANGVLVSSEGSAGLGPVTAKASAGCLERFPVAREGRLGSRLQDLKRRGFRVVALDPRGEEDWDEADLSGRVVLLAGGEGAGIRPGLLRLADRKIRIPLERGVESLNVSVSVAVVLFEAVRQRRKDRDREKSAQHP